MLHCYLFISWSLHTTLTSHLLKTFTTCFVIPSFVETSAVLSSHLLIFIYRIFLSSQQNLIAPSVIFGLYSKLHQTWTLSCLRWDGSEDSSSLLKHEKFWHSSFIMFKPGIKISSSFYCIFTIEYMGTHTFTWKNKIWVPLKQAPRKLVRWIARHIIW